MADRADAAEAAIGQAPGRLRTVQAFVNTLDIEESTDELASTAALTTWLTGAGLLDSAESEHGRESRISGWRWICGSRCAVCCARTRDTARRETRPPAWA